MSFNAATAGSSCGSEAMAARHLASTHKCSLEWLAESKTPQSSVSNIYGVVVLNGVSHESPLLGFASSAEVVIAADEDGVVHGVLPHVIVGDMDSAAPQHLDALQAAGAEVRRVSSQDENDLFKALNLAAAEYKQVGKWAILTQSGGRLDQQMQSLNALWTFHHKFDQLVLLSEASLTVLLPAPRGAEPPPLATYHIQRAPIQTDTCGLIPMGKVQQVHTEGLRWECDGCMAMGGLVSSSNEMTGSSVQVQTSGDLLWTASVELTWGNQ